MDWWLSNCAIKDRNLTLDGEKTGACNADASAELVQETVLNGPNGDDNDQMHKKLSCLIQNGFTFININFNNTKKPHLLTAPRHDTYLKQKKKTNKSKM